MTTTKSNKRKRLPDDVTEDRAGDLSFTDLPMIPILQFLEPEDRLPLSETCKFGLEAVENYCELILEAIVGPNNCKVDETFRERISQVSNGERLKHEVLFPKTDNGTYKPPFRLMVEKAKSTPLDQISMKNQANNDVTYNDKDKMSPSGTKIAVETDHEGIEVIELATKKCVAVFDLKVAKKTLGLPDDHYPLGKWLFLGDDRILLKSYHWIICWDFMLGSSESTPTDNDNCVVHLLYRTPPSGDDVRVELRDILPIGADEFVFVENDSKIQGDIIQERYCEIRSMNLRDGSTKTLFKRSKHSSIYLLAATTTSSNIGNKWLLLADHRNSNDFKLYVYNLETMELADIWDPKGRPYNYVVWQNASNGNKVRVSYLHNCRKSKSEIITLKVLDLDPNTGKLSLSHSINVHDDVDVTCDADILAVTGNQALIHYDYGYFSSISNSAFLFNLNPTSTKSYGKNGQLITNPERDSWWGAAVSTVHNAWYLRDSNENQIMVYLHSEPTLS